jgi:hypothetical protein
MAESGFRAPAGAHDFFTLLALNPCEQIAQEPGISLNRSSLRASVGIERR